ncbi:MAG: tyrosine--tRNA ligase [Candidatus Hodarchaeota archaeon]
MNVEDKLKLVKKGAEEIIMEDEIRTILQEKQKPRTYIGFELSGFLHLGTGIICGNKFKNMADAGFETIVFLADWHSLINNKLNADMEKIKIAGEYFIKGFESVGVKGPNIKYIWGSEIVENVKYWEKVIRVAKNATLSRVLRTLPIMGRSSEGDIESSFIYYPAMQVADIFDMEIDVACGGMDQRKAHMLARDVAEKAGNKKPACVHTPLLTGLKGLGDKMDADAVPDLGMVIEGKMSKSKPDSCIFIHDDEEEITRKIKGAHCPAKILNGNPVTDILKYTIFNEVDSFLIERKPKFGGDVTYNSFLDFSKDFKEGTIHPLDLKFAVAKNLAEILKPSRKFFDKHSAILDEMEKLKKD